MSRARIISAARSSRRSAVTTDISLWDHLVLKENLMSRPAFVLAYFKRCQVEALDQLQIYQEIARDKPQVAARIARAAAQMGIPEHLDELLDDVLSDQPGGV